jgi:CheY-like chemotaxis protein
MKATRGPFFAGRGKVLVVEDEAIIAMDMANILRHHGCEIAAVVSSGEESIVQAERHRPDLVFMDVRLKGTVSGLEAGLQIRDRLHIPVVYLTAFGEDIAADPVGSTRDFPRIMKPFIEREIETILGRFLPSRNN